MWQNVPPHSIKIKIHCVKCTPAAPPSTGKFLHDALELCNIKLNAKFKLPTSFSSEIAAGSKVRPDHVMGDARWLKRYQ